MTQEDEVAARQGGNIGKDLFRRIPVHPFMLMFHLDLHHYVWVHVEDMKPYAYQPDLKQKLVLPEEQTDLIDILTAEMDVLMDDIVAGKSGGTTVLCAGPPGVGKTLTAEVYAEIVRRPLYRVHSGQLGLNVAAMETALKEALLRAQRWGAVMLIDEADVYIKRRAGRHDHERGGRRVPARARIFQRPVVPHHQPHRRYRRGDRLALHRADPLPFAGRRGAPPHLGRDGGAVRARRSTRA